jgi:hypothetical protein
MLTPISPSDWIFWNEFRRFLVNTPQRGVFLADCNPGRLCSDPFLDEGYAEMVVHQGDAEARHLPEQEGETQPRSQGQEKPITM